MKYEVKKAVELKPFVADALGLSKSKAKELIDSKSIFVNGRRAWIATFALKSGDIVETPDDLPSKPAGKIKILYEDGKIIAADKPAGVVADRDGASIEALLQKQTGNRNLCAAHRLDKETSGVMLFAKNAQALDELIKLWEEKAVKKTYLALARGYADFDHKEVSSKVDGKDAVSLFTVKSRSEELTLFKVEALTGRKHQVRVHLASIGHPLAGEKQYASLSIKDDFLKSIARQMLHAYELEVETPWAGKIKITSQPPEDFKKTARKAGLRI